MYVCERRDQEFREGVTFLFCFVWGWQGITKKAKS